MKYRVIKFFVFLCLSLTISMRIVGQGGNEPNPKTEYIFLEDNTGINRTKYKEDLEAATIQLNTVFELVDEEHQLGLFNNVKIYDYGFFLHNTSYENGRIETLNEIRKKIPTTEYYIIFARESDSHGLNSNLHVLSNLPSFNCFSDQEFERRLKAYVDYSEYINVFEFQRDLLNTFISNQLYFLYICCEQNPISGELVKNDSKKSICVEEDMYLELESKIDKDFLIAYLGCKSCDKLSCYEGSVPRASALETIIDNLDDSYPWCFHTGVLGYKKKTRPPWQENYIIKKPKTTTETLECLVSTGLTEKKLDVHDYGAFCIITNVGFDLAGHIAKEGNEEALEKFKMVISSLSSRTLDDEEIRTLSKGMGCLLKKLSESEKFELLKGLLLSQQYRELEEQHNLFAFFREDYSSLIYLVIDAIRDVDLYRFLKEDRSIIPKIVNFDVNNAVKERLRVLLISKYHKVIFDFDTEYLFNDLVSRTYPFTIHEGVMFRRPEFEAANDGKGSIEIKKFAFRTITVSDYCSYPTSRGGDLESELTPDIIDNLSPIMLPNLNLQGEANYFLFPAFMLEFLTDDVNADNLWAAGGLVLDVGLTVAGGVGVYSMIVKGIANANKVTLTLRLTEALTGTGHLILSASNCSSSECKYLANFMLIAGIASSSAEMFITFKDPLYHAASRITDIDNQRDIRKSLPEDFLIHRVDILKNRLSPGFIDYVKTCSEKRKLLLNTLDDHVLIDISKNFTEYSKSVGLLIEDLTKSIKILKGGERANKFADFLNLHPGGVKAWKVLDDIGDATSVALKTDVIFLERFNGLLQNPQYSNILDPLTSGAHNKLLGHGVNNTEEAAMKLFKGDDYFRNYNKALAGDLPMTPEYHAMKVLMEAAHTKLPKVNDAIVFRGAGSSESEFASNLVEGQKFDFEGRFTSSSFDEFTADLFRRGNGGNVIWRIESKTGVDIKKINAGESEVLFKPFAKFELLNVTRSSSNSEVLIYSIKELK